MRRHPRLQQLSSSILNEVPWFRQSLLEWSKSNRRSFPWRDTGRTPYELVIAEILLQRTQALAVARVYPSFLTRFPSWEALANSSHEELKPFLVSLGLSTVRAEILLRVARAIRNNGDTVPSTSIELEQLKGIGQYTANAILLLVHGQAVPLLDANMARVLERYFGPRTRADIRDDPFLHALAREVVRGRGSVEINWAVLDLAALVCKPGKPLCPECPLRRRCEFALITRLGNGGFSEYESTGSNTITPWPHLHSHERIAEVGRLGENEEPGD